MSISAMCTGKVPISKCIERTGKPPIGTRWVDINKGDNVHPEYRSRVVAQEINVEKREDLFAATPPLESMKLLLSLAVTEGIGYQKGKKKQGKKLDFIDIRRAYYHAPARREVFVKLPPGDEEEGMCGELIKSPPGTRDAAQNWEEEYRVIMESLGFQSGRITPCTFWHAARDIRAVVHGDDFTIMADEQQLDWFRPEISNKFDAKFRGRIGPDITDDKSTRILNRIVTWTPNGITYEADQRHGEIIIQQLGLEAGAKAVGTPGIKQELGTTQEDLEELSIKESTMYRAMTAR